MSSDPRTRGVDPRRTPPPDDWTAEMAAAHGPVAVTGNALTVLERRYLKKADGMETPAEMVARVAWNVALAELPRDREPGDEDWERVRSRAGAFYGVINRLDFLPNSPTLMNAGKELQQLSACFVLPVGDSMEEIFDSVKHTALIHKSGGGTGFSFSRLRPRNDLVRSTKGVSSGPISFMTVFDAATETIKQGGTRRGANMGILRVDHPDILDFIECKKDKVRLNNFNISVAATDEFMKAVQDGTEYALRNPRNGEPVHRLPARDVFEKIVEAAWRNGEPGIVFIDRINRDNPTPHVGQIESTNPCGEQPLLPYESCNLGSINLRNFVHGTDGSAAIDWKRLGEVVEIAVRFLDDVIDMNEYPLPQIESLTKANRKIGLGVMGFADALATMSVPYDSLDAERVAREVMEFVRRFGHEASMDLAEERGPFPNFPGSAHDRGGVRPRRNATVTTIAPTGTISIIAGVSSGIEPLFAVSYLRNVMDRDVLVEVNPVFEKVMRDRGLYTDDLMKEIAEKGSPRHVDAVPEDVRRAFATSHDISPEAHLRMQAIFQQYTDNAVSKTVNFPEDATVDDVRKVYELAYRLGCKGVTVYRDKSRDEQVLNVGKVNESAAQGPVVQGVSSPAVELDDDGYIVPKPRDGALLGVTKEMPTGCGKLYVTLNYRDRLFEVFTQMGKAGGCAASQTEAIGRTISMALRSGISPRALVKQLRGISCHKTCGFGKNEIKSCSDAVGQSIEWFLENFDHIQTERLLPKPLFPADEGHAAQPAALPLFEPVTRGACPDCGGQVYHVEGCLKCTCGYSEC